MWGVTALIKLKLTRIIALIIALAPLFTVACSRESKQFEAQLLTTLDGKRTIKLITASALAWTDESGVRIIGAYSAVDRETL